MRHLLTVDRIAAALVWLALTTVTALGQIAPDQGDGYPAPETATATMPPMTWPACSPHCPPNTPVVDARPAATQASEQGGAVTPVIGSAVYQERVALPMIVRFQ